MNGKSMTEDARLLKRFFKLLKLADKYERMAHRVFLRAQFLRITGGEK